MIRSTLGALKFLFIGPMILVMLGVICLFRVVAAVVAVGGIVALIALIRRG